MKNLVDNNSNNIIIYNTLRRLGIRPSHAGIKLILRAVQLLEHQSDSVCMQDIYTELSNESNSFTPSKVRLLIKYAIEHRNEQKSIENFKSIFGYDYDEEMFTNKGFIEELSRVFNKTRYLN